ncbi:MAG: phosphoglucosamine mutase [Gammaproteobacteria bacterium]|nr:phosphoglucosamine mutase [Gammaproteobacteria bacterium]
MRAQRKYFGTDGVRGHVGESLINPEFVLRLGWAAGKVLGGKKPGKVIIGKDTRVSGYIFESVLEAGLAAAGADVRLIGPMPTPAIAYLTRTLRADAGIVISASHNPYFDNGIKFFSRDGTKLDDDIEMAIEEKLDEAMQMVSAGKLGKVKRYPDACGRYIEFCKSTFGNFNASLKGKKIVVDCANGATYIVAPRIFRELGAEVIELNVHPDGFNINENCGSTNPEILQRIVKAEQADLGVAFDGDGDRVIMVDHRGEVVDGDEILYIIAKHGFVQGTLQGGVVGTVMSNLGFELALRKEGIDFVRAQVGDRYVLEQLNAKGWQLGGENSGHVVHLGMTTTGDGIITALQVLSAMVDANTSLFGVKCGMKKFPQVLVNVRISEKIEPQMLVAAQQAAKEFEKNLGENARVLLRPSGTEPLIRVMVEGEDAELVEKAAHELATIVKQNISG